jgi:hypothetical protein
MPVDKHTLGPWALRGFQIRADNGAGAHVATYQISRADGRLLAAAPELFELAQRLVAAEDAEEFGDRAWEIVHDARALIARVRTGAR